MMRENRGPLLGVTRARWNGNDRVLIIRRVSVALVTMKSKRCAYFELTLSRILSVKAWLQQLRLPGLRECGIESLRAVADRRKMRPP